MDQPRATWKRLEPHEGRIAWIAATATCELARGAAATIASIKAQHSILPVASSSRNGRTRDIPQSMTAIAGTGMPAIRFFAFG